jgi:hypothetical protein
VFVFKKGDLIVGLCMHQQMVPSPTPTPTPMPCPFMAMMMDAAAEAAAAAVQNLAAAAGEGKEPVLPMMINGMLAAAQGCVTPNDLLPHMPVPFPWAPGPKAPEDVCGVTEQPGPPASPAMPAGKVQMTKGSSAVSYGKGAFVRMGDPAKNCADPSPPSELAVVISPPCGSPVGSLG